MPNPNPNPNPNPDPDPDPNPNPHPNPNPNPNPNQVNGSVYSASAMPRTATIRYDAPASAEAAVRTMDGTRLRSHTLKVHRRRMPCTRA